MKSHYRVVVIGGGVVGCSVLYHLAKMGWKDSVHNLSSEVCTNFPPLILCFRQSHCRSRFVVWASIAA